jgi:hypothetical protein
MRLSPCACQNRARASVYLRCSASAASYTARVERYCLRARKRLTVHLADAAKPPRMKDARALLDALS